MKRIDFLKSLAVPFVIPLLAKNDIALFDGKRHHPIFSSLPQGQVGQVLAIVGGIPRWQTRLFIQNPCDIF